MCNADFLCTCNGSSDCPDHLACRDGACRRCIADEECGCGRYCGGGECHDRCVYDADCPRGSCHVETGRCVICDSDSDCPSGARCYQDGCVVPCPDDGCFIGFTCHPNGRCGGCDECDLGPRVDPVACQ